MSSTRSSARAAPSTASAAKRPEPKRRSTTNNFKTARPVQAGTRPNTMVINNHHHSAKKQVTDTTRPPDPLAEAHRIVLRSLRAGLVAAQRARRPRATECDAKPPRAGVLSVQKPLLALRLDRRSVSTARKLVDDRSAPSLKTPVDGRSSRRSGQRRRFVAPKAEKEVPSETRDRSARRDADLTKRARADDSRTGRSRAMEALLNIAGARGGAGGGFGAHDAERLIESLRDSRWTTSGPRAGPSSGRASSA